MDSAQETPAAPTDDQEFLDWVFDRAVQEIESGLPVDSSTLLCGREHLRERVEELVRLARGVAIGPISALGSARLLPRIAGYSVLEEIGSGGMGTVYLARQDALGGRPVALKLLPPDRALTPRARQRFREEANAIAKLRHPHIVAVHDVVHDEETQAYAMEWVEGSSLARVIDCLAQQQTASGATTQSDDARISLLEMHLNAPASALTGLTWPVYVIRLGIAIARALEAVHRAGFLHRDVKPSNILIRRDGTPLLSDFGLVREVDATVTQPGSFAGTAAYAAPEQLRGDAAGLDGRADVYSLGVTLYHALALRMPFSGHSATHILQQIERAAAAPLRRLNRKLPVDVQTVIAMAMEAEPAHRYATAGALAEDLERLLKLQPIRARPAGVVTRGLKFARRNRAAFVAAILGSALSLVLAAVAVVYTFFVPRWVAAHVAEARMALLDPEQSNLIYLREFWGASSENRQPPAWLATSLSAALRHYNAALRLAPFDEEIRAERDVVAEVRATAARATAVSAVAPARGRAPPVEAGPRSPPQADRPSDVNTELGPYTPATADTAVARAPGFLREVDEMAGRSGHGLEGRATGLRAFLTGDTDTALEAWLAYERARAPTAAPDPLVEAALGMLYVVRGESGRAYPRLQRAAETFPDAGFIHVYFAEAALRCGDIDRGGQILQLAEKMNRQDRHRAEQRVRALLHSLRGEDAEAEAVYRQCRVGNPIATFEYGLFLLARDRIWEAVGVLSELAAAPPAVPPASPRAQQAFVAAMDRWWEGLDSAARFRTMTAALDASPDSLVPRLRTYVDCAGVPLAARPPVETPSSLSTGRQAASGTPLGLGDTNSSDFAPLPGENSSAFLQKASLSDIAQIMEVQNMDRWDRIDRYPRWLKWLQGLAWLSPWPQTASTRVERIALALAVGVAALTAGDQTYAAGTPCTAAPCFQGLGDLPGGQTYSSVSALSSDGSTVVGTSFSAACDTTYAGEAFRWREDSGIVALGDLPGAHHLGIAYGVSADGSTVTGWSSSSEGCDANSYNAEAFLWTNAGMVGLGVGTDGACLSSAANVSDDGMIVGGSMRAGGQDHMAAWTSGSGWTILTTVYSSGFAMSRNGVWFVGFADLMGSLVPARWSSATGLDYVGELPGGATLGFGHGASNSGEVVGTSSSGNGLEAFAWSDSSGMVPLSDLPGGAFLSEAHGIASGGELVVGYGSSTDGEEAVLWDESRTIYRVMELLHQHGVCVPGNWLLQRTSDVVINGDIVTLCGSATNPDGNTEGWIARYDATTVASDLDSDGLSDVCDPDDDNDGVEDANDAAPLDPGLCEDLDTDGCDDCSVGLDGLGPLADNDPASDGPDADADTICDTGDNCPDDANAAQEDDDADGVGNVCDNCSLANADQADCEPNGVGDVCDIALCAGCSPACQDCNRNGVPDPCDIASGVSFDVDPPDGNGIPDECESCPADLNLDLLINPIDLALLLGAWGACPAGPCPADLNGDCVVNASDLALLLGGWGACP